jgi:hypothetical protein
MVEREIFCAEKGIYLTPDKISILLVKKPQMFHFTIYLTFPASSKCHKSILLKLKEENIEETW